jgi:hypothetical protein
MALGKLGGGAFGHLGGPLGGASGSIPPTVLSDGSGGTYTMRADGLYVYSVDSSLWILCGDSDGAFGIDSSGNYYGQAYP